MRDYRKMIEDVDELLQDDEAASLIDHVHWLNPKHLFSQDDAAKMSKLLGKIYSIAHGVTCCCGEKYEINAPPFETDEDYANNLSGN